MPLILDSWTATAGLLLIPIALAARYWIRPRPYPGIPHHPVTSWLGDIPKLAADTRKYGNIFEMQDRTAVIPSSVETLGPIFQVLVGPVSKLIFVADAQEIDDVLLRSGSKHLDLSEGNIAMFSSLVPEGQVSLKTNDTWRRHRRITTPLMSSTYLSRTAPTISASARRLVSLWERKTEMLKQSDGICFSCQDDFHMAALDVVSTVVAGQSLGLLPDALDQLRNVKPQVDANGGATFDIKPIPLVESFHHFLSITGVSSFPPPVTRIVKRLWTLKPSFSRAYSKFDAYIQRCASDSRARINESRALGEEAPAFRSMMDMIIAKEGTPGDEFTPSELRDEVLTFMLGGHDTIANVMLFGIKYMTDAPEVQRKLRAELLSVLEDAPDRRALTYAEVTSDKLPYLEAVTTEIIRCAKVAGGSRRTTTSPIKIFGYDIPVGADIIFLTMSADDLQSEENIPQIRARDALRSSTSLKHGTGGRSPWKDAGAFDPSRWLVTDETTGTVKFNPKAGYNTPFGLGLRACAGKQLALLELKIYLATLNLAFFFDAVPEVFASHRAHMNVTRIPDLAYVVPRTWPADSPGRL